MAPTQHDAFAIRDALIPSEGMTGLDRATVVIAAGVVREVLPPDAALPQGFATLAAAGRILMPGFIDAHSHAEGALGRETPELGLLRQGITTAIIGQDGVSFAPATAESASMNERYFSAINGPVPPALSGDCSVDDVLTHFSSQSRINAAMLLPAGTLRSAVAGFTAEPLTESQLEAATELAVASLDAGACGISLGLEYVPNGFADRRELLRYAGIAAASGAPLVAHLRGYEQSAPQGLAEFFGLARETGAPIHISHLHAPAALVLPAIDEAIDSGISVTFDSYPYRRGNTILTMLALPARLQEGGPAATLAALADRATLEELRRDWFPSIAELLSRVTVASAAHPDWRWVEGQLLPAAAAAAGQELGEFVCELLLATGLGVGAIVQQPASNQIADVRAIANHPAHLGGSDGIYLGSHPHPRGWGSFARMLRRHVVEWRDWSWAEAADHLSYRAAARFSLGDRGRARPGSIADFCLVHPEEIADGADYDAPTRPARGIMEVFIAGVPVLSQGTLTDRYPGHGLRRPMWTPTL